LLISIADLAVTDTRNSQTKLDSVQASSSDVILTVRFVRTAGLGSSEMLPRGPNGRFPEAAPQRPSGQRMSVQGRD
tara:strand:- start:268 stop:495 length:228 start_codon:yes stop_codon:yes gene_type:complete